MRELDHSVRDTFTIVGGPQALSAPVLLSVALLGLVGTVSNVIWRLGADITPSLVRYVVLMSLTGAIVISVRVTVLPVTPRPSRPGLVLAVYSGTIAGVLLFTHAYLPIPNGEDDTLVDYFVLPFIVAVSALCVVSYLIGSRRRQETLTAQVHARYEELIALQARHEAAIEEARLELQDRVAASLDRRLREISGTIDDLDPADRSGIREAGRLLTSTVTDVVRPLSHSIADPVSPTRTDVRNQAEATSTPVSLTGIDVGKALRPGWATLIFGGLGMVLSQAVGTEGRATLVRLLFTSVLFIFIMIVRRVMPPSLALQPVPVALQMLFVIYIIAMVIARATYIVVRDSLAWNLPNIYTTQSFIVAIVVIASILSLVGITAEFRKASLRNLEEINESITLQNARLRQEIWHLRTSLSWYLHGPLQSSLISASIALSTPNISADRLQSLRETIAQATADLANYDVVPRSIRQALRENQHLWGGICTIEIQLPGEVEELVDLNPALVAVVSEITREGIGNAIRHGDAGHVQVRLALEQDGVLGISIIDNGRGLPSDYAPGLGSSVLEQVCLDWSRTSTGEGTRLVATLAV